MFTVVTPATDRSLLTTAELRTVVGVSDASRDAELAALNIQVSDLIARECGVVSDGINPPTLRRETVAETFRSRAWRCGSGGLLLARRPVFTVSQITEDGEALTVADYELDRGAGLLLRLSGDVRSAWAFNGLSVQYVAGYDVVPEDLKLAAAMTAREMLSQRSRDPLMKREVVNGVGELEYWVGASATGSALSPAILAILAPYRTIRL